MFKLFFISRHTVTENIFKLMQFQAIKKEYSTENITFFLKVNVQ